jgi:hypothetical protein
MTKSQGGNLLRTLKFLNGRVLRRQAADGKDVHGIEYAAIRVSWISLVRHDSEYVLRQTAGFPR